MPVAACRYFVRRLFDSIFIFTYLHNNILFGMKMMVMMMMIGPSVGLSVDWSIGRAVGRTNISLKFKLFSA